LGNFGGFVDHCHNCGPVPASVNCGSIPTLGACGGQCGNCQHVGTHKQGNASTLYHGNCFHRHNCNC
jgi:hypothetical protein